MKTDRRRRSRTVIALADQGVYSLSNLVLTVAVARTATASEFGVFSLCYVVFLYLAGLIRGLTAEPFAIGYASRADEDWRRGVGAASGCAVSLALVAAFIIAGVSPTLPPEPSRSALVFSCVLAGLFLQDFLRYAALVAKRAEIALVSDTSQILVQIAAILLLVHFGHRDAWHMVAAWGSGGCVGAIVAMCWLKVRPRPSRVLAWLSENRSLGTSLAVDNATTQAGQHSGAVALSAVASVADVGALRGAATLFQPVSVLSMAVRGALLPELVRSKSHSTEQLTRDVWRTGVALVVLSGAWSATMLIVPDHLGRELLGATWELSVKLLPFIAVAQVITSFTTAPMVGMRAIGAGRRTLLARSITTPLAIGFQIAGAIIAGATGVVVGMAISRPLQCGVWWMHYRRALTDVRTAVRRGEPILDDRDYDVRD